jgi:hypothetical protein
MANRWPINCQRLRHGLSPCRGLNIEDCMTGADYLKLIKRPVEKIDVPGWGEVFTRGLTASEYDDFAESCRSADGKWRTNVGMLFRYGVVDVHGAHVFTDADVPKLNELTYGTARPIMNAIMRLSGLTADADAGKS